MRQMCSSETMNGSSFYPPLLVYFLRRYTQPFFFHLQNSISIQLTQDREEDSLGRSHKMVDDYIGMGQSSLIRLSEQKSRLKVGSNSSSPNQSPPTSLRHIEDDFNC